MFDKFEIGFINTLEKLIALSLYKKNKISEQYINKGLSNYYHSYIKAIIEGQIKRELAISNTSEIKQILYWFQQHISGDINIDFVSNLFCKDKPTAIKAIIDINPQINYDSKVLDLIDKKLSEVSISYISLDGEYDPLTHPQILKILEFFKIRNYRIKLITSGTNLDLCEKHIIENVTHFKLKHFINNGEEIGSYNKLQALKRIVEKTTNWAIPVKTHLNLIFKHFTPETLLKHLIFATESGISRVSISIDERNQKNLNLINSIINQYKKQIQIYLDADDTQINDFNICYLPSIRYVVSGDLNIYPCFKYGIEKKGPYKDYKVGKLEMLNDHNFIDKLRKAQNKINPILCKNCSYGESTLNQQMNKLMDIVHNNDELSIYRRIEHLPKNLLTDSKDFSQILLLMNTTYIHERETLNNLYQQLYKTSGFSKSNAGKLIKKIANKERLIREIYYAWQKMFCSATSNKGEEIVSFLNLAKKGELISKNVITVKGAISSVVNKILPASVIITDKEPFSFISKELESTDFHTSLRIFFINDIINGDNLKDILKYVETEKVSTLIGIGGGKTMDFLKFISYKTNIKSIAIPTSLSTHVYASPKIHILQPISELGYSQTIDGEPAHLSILDIDLLEKLENENIQLIRAGLGDILAFYTAREDWKLACKTGHDTYNYYVDSLIKNIIKKLYSTDFKKPLREFWLEYIEMQVLLCSITDWAGSAPASGSEHLFANKIESLSPEPVLHGEMVALGVLLVSQMLGLDIIKLKKILDNIGLDLSLKKYNFNINLILEAFTEGKIYGKEKNRYTCLENMMVDLKLLNSAINVLQKEYKIL